MKLSRRALVLIFPVVLASYALAASVAYVTQRDSTLRLEQARLQQQLGHLAVLFRNEETINRGLLQSIAASAALRLFLQESDDGYRVGALGVRLQQSIRSLTDDPAKFVSFTALRGTLEVEHYFENSPDPFATVGPGQIELARSLIAGARQASWAYIDRDGPAPLIVNSQFVDPLTMNRPHARDAGAILLQTAIRPDRFLAMKRDMEREYGAPVDISDQRPRPRGALSASTELGAHLYVGLTPAASYVSERTTALAGLLALGALVMSLFSITLLMALIRRFITVPIATLDRQLTEVMAGVRKTISTDVETAEIRSLSENMKRLHDDVVLSLTRIQEASWTDTLTGVSNRAHFNILSAAAITTARDAGTRCALLFIDVDNFKFVNDKYGHEIGDGLLQTLATRIGDVVRTAALRPGVSNAAFVRLSGDEFAVLLETPDDRGAADDLARAILAVFADGFDVYGERFPVAVSVGVASFPDDAGGVTELLANADAAMYQAKAAGKNRFAHFSREIEAQRLRARAVLDELRSVDPDDEFQLVYMPIVDGDRGVKGCEALVRWTSPVLGVVPPDEFVPIAERNGLFAKLDRWVIDQALQDHGQLTAWFGPDFVLSINVSSAELHATALRDFVVERLAAHGVAPERVELELTETFSVGVDGEARRNVEAFRAAGLRVAIDDFGSGYTSIQQITDYAVDTIKFDRSLVDRLTAERSQAATLAALIALCHAQGVSVVAEGVDTESKIVLLARAGCDLFQGYGICEPRTLAEIGLWALANVARERGVRTAANAAGRPERKQI